MFSMIDSGQDHFNVDPYSRPEDEAAATLEELMGKSDGSASTEKIDRAFTGGEKEVLSFGLEQ